MRWKRARRPLILLTVIVFWLLAAGWLTAPLLQFVQARAPDRPPLEYAPRTAIILLGAGTRYAPDNQLVPRPDALSRIAVSAEQYFACERSGATCRIIVSGGNPQHHSATEADNYLPYLLRLGVPRADIVLESASRTTYENARNVSRILADSHYDSLIVVTSAYHMRRALLDFHRFGLDPRPLVSNYRHARVGVMPRIRNLVNAEMALHELVGIAQFHVYCALGWF